MSFQRHAQIQCYSPALRSGGLRYMHYSVGRHQCRKAASGSSGGGKSPVLSGASVPGGGRFATPIDPDKMQEMFTPQQLSYWPKGYRPAQSVAFFLYPKGVPLSEIVDARKSIRSDTQHELQRDFAGDYNLWMRSAFEQFLNGLHEGEEANDRECATRLRALKRVLSRQRLPKLKDVYHAFDLLPVNYSTTTKKEESQLTTTSFSAQLQNHLNNFHFTPYAALQDFAMRPIQNCENLQQLIKFYDFPSIHNLLHTYFDSLSPLRYIALRSREELFYTEEFVTELALYLRRQIDEKLDVADKERPILTLFGQGRLAHALNETHVLNGHRVIACAPPSRKYNEHPLAGSSFLKNENIHEQFFTKFPVEICKKSITEAIQNYEPSIIIAEPHSDRDWTAEMRGYYSVREVLMLGPVDGPGMGSFTFPWLSFGVAPGPHTFWNYTDTLQKMLMPQRKPAGGGSSLPTSSVNSHAPFPTNPSAAAASSLSAKAVAAGGVLKKLTQVEIDKEVNAAAKDSVYMPTDAPYLLQNYEKCYVDELSKLLVYSNDTPQFPFQSRVASFRRTVIPKTPEFILEKQKRKQQK